MQQGIFLTQLYKLDYLAGSKIKNMAVGTTSRAFSAFIASVEIHITIALVQESSAIIFPPVHPGKTG